MAVSNIVLLELNNDDYIIDIGRITRVNNNKTDKNLFIYFIEEDPTEVINYDESEADKVKEFVKNTFTKMKSYHEDMKKNIAAMQNIVLNG